MLIRPWLHTLKSHFSQPTPRRRRSNRSVRLQVAAHIELLEERVLLSSTGGVDHHAGRPFFETHIINGSAFEFAWDPAAAGAAETEGAAAQTSSALSPLDSIPALHSNPGASVSLFLDFDGHFEPVWGGWTDVTTRVYDVDGDDTTFSDTELANINLIWQLVSEDFAPFNIDVTTVEPAVLAEGMPIDDANGLALRIAIGGSWEDWYGSSAGGVAPIGAFTNSIANVAYVFSDNLFGGQALSVGDTVSHEAGHGFGLFHQSSYDANGVKTAEYNPGDGYWAPIMGGGGPVVSTWHNGTSSQGSTVFQDDMAILAGTTNGFGFRSDDHGDTIAAPTALSTDGTTWSGAGIVETNSDADAFSFTISSEDTYRISVAVDAFAPNLDVVLDLRHAAGGLIASADPQETPDAEIAENLMPGDYVVQVTKSTSYGWVGQYSINIDEAPVGVTAMPTAVPLTTGEDGRTATFDVILDTQPTADVIVPLSSSDLTEGTLSATSLTFTTATWNVPQTVTISGVDDSTEDGHVNYNVALGLLVSGDTEYSGLNPADVLVTNLDNDTPGWVLQLGGIGIERARDVNIDADGNIYLLGRFSDTVDFDPGPGTFDLTSLGGEDGFIAKYTRDQQFVWARRFGGADGTENTRSIEFDSADNVYIVGKSNSSSMDFGPITVTNQGGDEAYAAKLDPDGTFQWAHSWGSTGKDQAQGLAVDDAGNVHIVGQFSNTVDFDPGAASFDLTSQGDVDGYLLHLDTNGDFVSAMSVGGPEKDVIQRVAVDGTGNVYTAGVFYGTAQFGTSDGTTPVFLTSAGSSDTFLMNVAADGNTQWIRQAAGASSVGNGNVDVGFDGFGGVYFTGNIFDTIDFGSGNPSLVSAGDTDAYITRWDTDGNLVWSGQISGPEDIGITGIRFDVQGNPYFAGFFNGTADFDVGPGTVEQNSWVGQDSFVLKLDAAGDFQWVEQVEHNSGTSGAVSIDDAGNVYLMGEFSGTAIFPTGKVIASAGSSDAYLLKLTMAEGITVSPTAGSVTTEDGGTTTFTVVLDLPPTADVTIGLSSDDASEGTISPASLTFTPTNWDVPQTVTVTGQDDTDFDFDVAYSIVTSAATSADPGYNGFDPSNVSVLNLDNDLTTTTYNSADAPKALKDAKGRRSGKTNSTLTISDTFDIHDLSVQLDITHTRVEDLDVYLLGPDGVTRVELFTDVGGNFDNFTGLILDDQASTPITSGTAPFTGTFQPEGLLSDFNLMSAAGTWTLQIEDDTKFEVGTLNSWSIIVTHAVPSTLR